IPFGAVFCHCEDWSECENRFTGRLLPPVAHVLYVALSGTGCTSIPTLARMAAFDAVAPAGTVPNSAASSGQLGCRPYFSGILLLPGPGVVVMGSSVPCASASPCRDAA